MCQEIAEYCHIMHFITPTVIILWNTIGMLAVGVGLMRFPCEKSYSNTLLPIPLPAEKRTVTSVRGRHTLNSVAKSLSSLHAVAKVRAQV